MVIRTLADTWSYEFESLAVTLNLSCVVPTVLQWTTTIPSALATLQCSTTTSSLRSTCTLLHAIAPIAKLCTVSTPMCEGDSCKRYLQNSIPCCQSPVSDISRIASPAVNHQCLSITSVCQSPVSDIIDAKLWTTYCQCLTCQFLFQISIQGHGARALLASQPQLGAQ